MKATRPWSCLSLLLWIVLITFMASSSLKSYGDEPGAAVKSAIQAMNEGNVKDAYEIFHQEAVRSTSTLDVTTSLDRGLTCLQQLGRDSELDAFIEEVVAAHPENWRILAAAGRAYLRVPHYGFMIAGEFERGQHRGGGDYAMCFRRDRVRAMQLLVKAHELGAGDEKQVEVAQVCFGLAEAIMLNHAGDAAWQMQTLTDLAQLPDYEQENYGPGYTSGAPVDADGNPVYHALPDSWQAARSDGQRWRWALHRAAELAPLRKPEAQFQFAGFLLQQFGVETLQNSGWRFDFGQSADDPLERESGILALHTLSENETTARLATGIKRFTLPDEFNYLKIYRQLADSEGAYASNACWQLANSYLNRRQFDKAAEQFRAGEKRFPKSGQPWREQVQQIEGNWGRFESSATQAAGTGAKLQYRFRNARRVQLDARRIDIQKFFTDLKEYLTSRSRQKDIDWNRLNVDRLGYEIIQKGQQKYLKEEVARWNLELDPRAGHFDRVVTITTPLQQAGAYLVTARLADGNESKVVVWLEDLALITKPTPKGGLYFVGDANTGLPVARANVEFLGFRVQYDGGRPSIRSRNFAEYSDDHGLLTLPGDEDHRDYQWLALARDSAGRMAYLGFSQVWYAQNYDPDYEAQKAFAITDRPVYRPSQKVHFKVWVQQAKYDQPDVSAYAGRPFTVWISNPKDERVYEQRMEADKYGGIEGEFALPADATLGEYHLQLNELPIHAFHAPFDNFQPGMRRFGGIFRVEEYKKPEFEVSIEAPDKPVSLGESFAAKIKATYYFGSPVTEATVKYKVLRTAFGDQWYPPTPWDWLYGTGSWWFAADYEWYPGWRQWGCRCPVPWWFWRAPEQPEVIATAEVPIGPDGTVDVKIDTTLAKELYGNQDHSYQIQAEVVDQSRRTIVANGQVLVAREPFRVFSWLQRGYYRVGDTIEANFAARTIDGKPVRASAVAKLYKINYQDGKPQEVEIKSWELSADADGQVRLKVAASETGQYRLSCTVRDSEGHASEGATIFTVIGVGFDGRQFEFNDIELIPERRDYAPGDKVALQVNVNHAGGYVLLFVRAANGIYPQPQPVRLQGKSTVVEIGVTQKDMPNFFVEAVTVAEGKVHTAIREILVPPQKRVIDVKVEPSATEYLPGEMAKVKLQITDFDGRPFVGSTVVAIYDKSLEYISGGSNVPEIRSFFWKWRRQHQPRSQINLQRWFPNLPVDEKYMQDLGIFGQILQPQERMANGRGGQRQAGMAGRAGLGMEMADEASPAAAGSFREGDAMAKTAMAAPAEALGGQPPAAVVQPMIRQTFADTAFWTGSLTTDADGRAEVELKMPENLTAWRIRVWGMGHGTRVGEGQTEVVTRKNLIVRLQSPRFFVETDEVVLTANVHNYLKSAKQVQVKLDLEGGTLEALDTHALQQVVKIDPDGEARVDWRVKVIEEGEAVIRMMALTDEESDAMQMKFPVYVHGMLKMDSYTGVLRKADKSGQFKVVVPEKRRPAQTRLEVRYSPTLAMAMLDAIPYLLDYPYGCTEQTLNRFLPAVMARNTLRRMGVDLEALRQERVNLNSQQLGDAQQRRARWKHLARSPVFDSNELTAIVKKGVERLTEMQLSDGGWGWFSGYGEFSSPHTTAVVVHGLQVAAQNDVALVPGVLERGIVWLKTYQEKQLAMLDNVKDGKVLNKKLAAKITADNLDALVFMILTDAGEKNDRMRDYLYRDRTRLSVYSLAMYGLALHKLNETEKLAMVLRNISQYLVEDDENQTAYLKLNDGTWWVWYGSETEAHAYYLKLLAATQPDSPVAPRLVKYMLNNRQHATYWNSTRDTALVIEAFADYLAATKEASPNMTVEVWVDGQKKNEVKIDAGNLFTYDNALVIEGPELTAGEHVVELRKQGDGPLYYSGYLTNFTLQDRIFKSGLELKVQRKYYRLRREEVATEAAGSRGQVVGKQVEKYVREPLNNLDEVESGQLVEIELEVESKNDYEYVLLEDMKPSGFEPVDLRSGYTGNAMGAYVEFRDNRVTMFLRELARGRHSVSYRMRAETPGKFSALPTKAYGMYAPELQGNSDEIKLRVMESQ